MKRYILIALDYDEFWDEDEADDDANDRVNEIKQIGGSFLSDVTVTPLPDFEADLDEIGAALDIAGECVAAAHDEKKAGDINLASLVVNTLKEIIK